MTLYAGERVKIRSQPEDFNGNLLTDADSVTVTVTVWDPDDTVVVDEELLAFDASDTLDDDRLAGGAWSYAWDTPSTTGSFWARVKVVGAAVGDKGAWEFQRIRLNKNKKS